MWFEKHVCEYVYMYAVSRVMLWSHTAGDGAGDAYAMYWSGRSGLTRHLLHST